MGAKNGKTETVTIEDPRQCVGKLKAIGGSKSDAWNNIIANDTFNALWLKGSDSESRNRTMTGVLSGLMGIAPRDELEGMLAAQLIASHAAAMECYRRSMHPEQTFAGRSENLTQANKLSRTSTILLEALNRHRGKGQQKVTVEHVNVHAGGQAIVGSVDASGEGTRKNSEEQPHAIAYAPGTPMRSTNPEGEPVPIASNAERPMSDARREIARATERK
jgi:hypothetical protein